MFTQLVQDGSRKQRQLIAAGVALHTVILIWGLHPPEPRLLTPVSVAYGQNGPSVTRLYWPSNNPDASTASSPEQATEIYRRRRLAQQKLIWRQNTQLAKLPARSLPTDGEDSAKTQTISNLGHGAQAGLPYGTLSHGPAFGDEIRPAIPFRTADPVAYPWELPAEEGRVVVEITIDDRGEIVSKVVLQSLGPTLDNKVLAALENWHFHPATHNGAAIASKQDAIFPFKARG